MARNKRPTHPETPVTDTLEGTLRTGANPATDAPPKPTKAKVAQQKLAEGAKALQAEAVKAAKGKRGQPTKFTQELWDEIVDRLACNENIVDICAEENMPSFYTVRKWWRANPELKRDVEEAWTDATYFLHYFNDSALAGGKMSVNDFRRDEARANNNRWFMGKANRRIFGDKQTVDLNQTVSVNIPVWATALPTQSEDGEIIDADAIYEAETVKRLTQRDDTQTPD